MYESNQMSDRALALLVVGIIVGLVAISFFGGCYIYPQWGVWQKGLAGKAQLREAEWNRQILIEEAQARKASATHLAAAEVERAKGMAAANAIIGESLKDNEAYLRYLWIQGLHDGSSEVIYIPTEANLPILEAVRQLQDKSPPQEAQQ